MITAPFGNKQGANAAAGGPAPPPQAQPAVSTMDPGSAPFGDIVNPGDFNLDFTTDGPDVLENFDFDSFLHNTDDANGFANYDFLNIGQ
jgi:hypothetical protein